MADFPIRYVPASPVVIPGDVILGIRNDTPGDLGNANSALVPSQYDSAGSLRLTGEGGKATYIANSQFVCDSTATDIWYFPGNATVTTKILWMLISSVATTAITGRLALILRSALDTAGTAVASALTAYDQRNGTSGAPTGAPKHYTAHPTGLGAVLGSGTSNIWSKQFYQGPAASATIPPNDAFVDFRSMFGAQGLRLAGTGQILALNAAAALGAGGNLWDVTCCFVEEPTTA